LRPSTAVRRGSSVTDEPPGAPALRLQVDFAQRVRKITHREVRERLATAGRPRSMRPSEGPTGGEMGRAFGQSRRSRAEDSGLAALELVGAIPGFLHPFVAKPVLPPEQTSGVSRPSTSDNRSGGCLLLSASVSRARARGRAWPQAGPCGCRGGSPRRMPR
jgi:hypothetical protein